MRDAVWSTNNQSPRRRSIYKRLHVPRRRRSLYARRVHRLRPFATLASPSLYIWPAAVTVTAQYAPFRVLRHFVR